MPNRFTTTAAVAAALVLAACSQDAPTGARTVRLALHAASAEEAGRPMTVSMSQEVFTNAMGTYYGDPDGFGTATLSINVGQERVCWELEVGNIALPATAAHIHHASAGLQGSPVIWLTAPDGNGDADGCTSASAELLRDILANPADYYVNVHNAQYAPGAVRSQLGRQP
jgi:hypothetical protein